MQKLYLADIEEALSLRRGGYAQPWDYCVGHTTFILRVSLPDAGEDFYLACVGCWRLEFDVGWEGADIRVESHGDKFLVHDGSRLRVSCAIIEGGYEDISLRAVLKQRRA